MHGLLRKRNLPAAIPAGRVVLRRVNGRRDLCYYAYLPRVLSNQQLPALVTVHGITINARVHARWFAPLAERMGVTLIAPVFEPAYYEDYQRLGRTGLGSRADHALNMMLEDWSAAVGRDNTPVNLFGFSGGGQFAHRYALVHPQRVNAQVLAAPGWYTFPDARRRYPYGIKPSKRLPKADFCIEEFLNIPTCVLVGECDTARDTALRQSTRLDRQQGENRLERGRNWVDAMRARSAASGFTTAYEFGLLPECDHDFEQCMRYGGLGERAVSFMYPKVFSNDSDDISSNNSSGQCK